MPDSPPPTLMKMAAEARQTNARRSVYSTRSWPCSSRIRFLTKLIMVVTPLKWFGLSDPKITVSVRRDLRITAIRIRDPPITVLHSLFSGGYLGCIALVKDNRVTVVIRDGPL